MLGEKDFESLGQKSVWGIDTAGFGALRIALLFGSAAVALALVLMPALQGVTGDRYAGGDYGIDTMTTGSVGYNGNYTIRRSVLQSSPNSVCIIRDNGTRIGDC